MQWPLPISLPVLMSSLVLFSVSVAGYFLIGGEGCGYEGNAPCISPEELGEYRMTEEWTENAGQKPTTETFRTMPVVVFPRKEVLVSGAQEEDEYYHFCASYLEPEKRISVYDLMRVVTECRYDFSLMDKYPGIDEMFRESAVYAAHNGVFVNALERQSEITPAMLYLVELGYAEEFFQEEDNSIVLHHALIYGGSLEYIEYLIELGADPGYIDPVIYRDSGINILWERDSVPHIPNEFFEQYIEAGVLDVNLGGGVIRDAVGDMNHAGKGREQVDWLLDLGADPNMEFLNDNGNAVSTCSVCYAWISTVRENADEYDEDYPQPLSGCFYLLSLNVCEDVPPELQNDPEVEAMREGS